MKQNCSLIYAAQMYAEKKTRTQSPTSRGLGKGGAEGGGGGGESGVAIAPTFFLYGVVFS